MKKLIAFLILICIMMITLCGCNNNIQPLSLPSVEEVDTINIELINNKKVSNKDTEYIEQVISLLLRAKATNKKSIQDAPVNTDFGSIHFENEKQTITIFYYKENGKYYIEQPYQGIYEADTDLELLFDEAE